MTEQEIRQAVERQRAWFQSGHTLPVDFRLRALRRLKDAVERREADIAAALRADLGKSGFEGYMCEIGMVRSELSHMLRRVPRYARERTVPTPLAQFPSRSFVKPSPKGVVLIMSPWNYPFLLTMGPLIDALAAGCTAVVKPSAYSPATSAVMAELLSECFPPEHVFPVTGGRAENQRLLDQKFDHIFFTGSQAVGKEVLRRAAEHLTSVTLELGGKSPCIVDETADLALAARRIVFGKFLNCGQTCVAPDYLLCPESIRDRLLGEIVKETERQLGKDPLANPDYGRIISEKHFRRVLGLLDEEKTVLGGRAEAESLRIAPTVLRDVTWEDPVMQEEIFGPVLPVLTYERFEDLFPLLARRPTPLALYFFSSDKRRIRQVKERCAFGGGCVNDTIIHLATTAMGFGGCGESGMGAYHGRRGFETFSHRKSMVDKKTWLDLPMRYQPYRPFHEKLIRLFLR
ncbi:aldehyde dehydrogenase [Dysosmobacter sp.]|uniref:aldehyde dehydrogenase n=1 Tax=Dysosmobacter sp. TaxID=2591382 RepID=UPI002A879571|nr:aldehyde dehydrogenase [Dysosmobacter sp.]MDY3282691.1 aldehyde dehydrogenase [Dysosmobacter sp.]